MPDVPASSKSKRNRRFSRRRFIAAGFLGAPMLAFADAKWIEPNWVGVRKISLTTGSPEHRIVQVSDIHHKGDRVYLKSVVDKINALSPDLVLFTGDLIEERDYLAEALEIMSGIKSPLYGVPGNHD